MNLTDKIKIGAKQIWHNFRYPDSRLIKGRIYRSICTAIVMYVGYRLLEGKEMEKTALFHISHVNVAFFLYSIIVFFMTARYLKAADGYPVKGMLFIAALSPMMVTLAFGLL